MIDIRVKRIYEAAEPEDGARVLVDRLWPRGVRKDAAGIDVWLRGLAPSAALRRWFNHEPTRWAAFQARYGRELETQTTEVAELTALARRGRVTLVFAAKDAAHNNATALRAWLTRRLATGPESRGGRAGRARRRRGRGFRSA